MSYNSRDLKNVYDKRTFKRIWLRIKLHCDRCPPNRGCNRRNKNKNRNWKEFRKTKWK